ncbi:triose-phosphate isomerase [Candidatus Nomurabacteria bacterium RIFCSPLOWO2_02_FULL_42_17]|uniref:Triosephosphate isomerase n=2 Tax=Candidatus Nomuraibacteriota TaxID=1752729 RepID=A0A1F6WHB4_9BACT|nr:MAG: triose-phosphate isomerase [Candidatus Nomurabacteria bacterium RIFCSPHIGHO2_02_FULL_42_24]OGI96083.1 MAG: triose-phosphate isomerase [Candidatus Nomurabacteria bacterium RIFCSPLOWO2_02_FULL_42_17]
MLKKIIIGNWKMNPPTYAGTQKIISGILPLVSRVKNKIEVVICPPFPWLTDFSHKLNKKVSFGAQDVFYEPAGPYTGEVSVDMLKSSGVKFVIVGHSERRALGETDEIVSKKVHACLKSSLIPIICVGERERDSGHTYLDLIKHQLKSALARVPRASAGKLIVAYEPVWAIGRKAARAATSEECGEMIIFIRKILSDIFGVKSAVRVRILYGGSVEPKNAGAYLTTRANGLLVGHDSLDPKKFGEILKVAQSM